MGLRARAEELLGKKLPDMRFYTDSSEFMQFIRGDVLCVEDQCYLITGITYEGRFGLDDEPKFWVRRALDMADGSAKIIKLAFFEQFMLPIGRVKVRCFRSPYKEERVLDLVRGDSRFMQGISLSDELGNSVRVLERIRGVPMSLRVDELKMGHEEYALTSLPGLLDKFREMIEAIGFLHEHHERHGDIRRDHIYQETEGGRWRWIDFDYNYDLKENPFGLDLLGLGNVLCFLVGKGIPTVHELHRDTPERLEGLDLGDVSLVIKSRIFNLKKLYPYLPEELNHVLMHFARSSEVFYENVGEMLDDFDRGRRALADLAGR